MSDRHWLSISGSRQSLFHGVSVGTIGATLMNVLVFCPSASSSVMLSSFVGFVVSDRFPDILMPRDRFGTLRSALFSFVGMEKVGTTIRIDSFRLLFRIRVPSNAKEKHIMVQKLFVIFSAPPDMHRNLAHNVVSCLTCFWICALVAFVESPVW